MTRPAATTVTPTGKQTRKHLAALIADHLDVAPAYEGTPTFDYLVGGVRISRDWQVTWPAELSDSAIDQLEQLVSQAGYQIARDGEHGEEQALVLAFPTTGWNERTRGNLEAMLASKTVLITKALSIEKMPVEYTGETVRFSWFTGQPAPAVAEATTLLLTCMIEAASNASRVSPKPPAGANEKYAMRCFLLRLGFIGDQYKTARRALLANLEGSAAWATLPAQFAAPNMAVV